VHPESYERALLYKAHEGHERRYLYRAEYYNPVLFWVIMFILKSLCTTVTMEGFETGRPLYSTIDRYILICFGRV
jgi:hypothetical protein